MPRTSVIHYITPSAISITPNANGKENDLAVYVVSGAKIKVYSPGVTELGFINNTYQEWTFRGRNRRLADSTKPYTIYARLQKLKKDDGYLVFVPKDERPEGWQDHYCYVTSNGLSPQYISGKGGASVKNDNYWFIRLGDVSLPESNQRVITFDTGILGTDQFNNEWNLNPDNLPLRIELDCSINGEDAGTRPYVEWGKELIMRARLVEGWTDTDVARFDHWEIRRNTGDEHDDARWNAIDRSTGYGKTGNISLSHDRGTGDDFNGAVSVTFTIIAMGTPDEGIGSSSASAESSSSSSSSSSYDDGLVPLAVTTLNVMAETVEQYALELSDSVASYDPPTDIYSPIGGIKVCIRAIDQKGNVFKLTRGQIESSSLIVQYALADSDAWTTMEFAGAATALAEAILDIRVFYAHQNVNVRIVKVLPDNSSSSSSSSSDTGSKLVELFRTPIAFVRNGEDSREREWIYLRSEGPLTFGDNPEGHLLPALIEGGEVEPLGAASGLDSNKQQEGWVPEGWWDEMQGTDEQYHYEYGAYRDWIRNEASSDSSSSDNEDRVDAHWGEFTTPRLWSYYAEDAVTYRCRWTLNSIETFQLKAAYTGAFRGTLPLVATLMKRVGNGAEQQVTATSSIVTVDFDGLSAESQPAPYNVTNPQFTISTSEHPEFIPFLSNVGLNAINIIFTVGGEPHAFSIPVIRDADEDSVKSTIDEYGSRYFLSKIYDDIANGLIGFLKGVWFGSRSWCIDGDGNATLNNMAVSGRTTADIIRSANYTGEGLADTGFQLTRDDGTGSSRLTVDNLHVRKKATFEELEVKKDTAIAGNQVYSAAANVISRTDYLDAQGNVLGYSYVRVPWLLRNVPFLLRRRFFGRLRKVRLTLSEEDAAGIVATRCYFLASDGDREVRNLWRADDQNGHDLARCQTFNLTGSNRASYLSGHGRKAGNVYWWRKVVAASSSPVRLDDGQEYHYIDVSMTQCDAGSDIPCAGDHVVQFGNDSNPDRMNLKVTEVNGGDAPADKYYRGVYTFDLNKSWWGGHPRKAMISPSSGYEFHGPSFRLVQEYGERPASIDRGAWSEIPPERDDYSPHGQVRKCYYYDKVSHKGCYWLCVLTPPDDGAHWTDAGGSHVTDNAYSQMPDAQKATCTRRQDYTTVEPGTDDSVWQKQVDRGTSVKGVRSYYAKAGMKLSMPEDDRQVTWKDSLSALGDIGEGWYVWTKNVTTYSDTLEDTATYTVSRQGIDGDGIHSIETKFHESKNLLTQAQLSALTDSLWKEYRELAHASGDFIYTRTKITYDKNDTPTVSYGVNRIGQDGVSYVATEEYYALGGSETAPPAGHPYTRQDGKPQAIPAGQLDITGDWSESRPVYQGDQRKYLWNFEVCYDTTAAVQVTQPVCIGNFARGIVSIVELYAVSAESVLSETVKALKWTDEVFDAAPTDEKPYQWNKTVTSYSDGTSDTFYHVSGVRGTKGSDGKDGKDGKDGQDGKEGIPGQNGKDGWMIAASPANVILTQSLSGSLSSFSSCTVGFTLMKGGTPVGVGSIGTPSSSTFNVSRNGLSVIVSSPKKNDGSYNTEGSFTVKVYATDPDTAVTVEFEMAVPCYANLLGTWKEAVEGGVKEIAAEQTRFEIENGNLVRNDNTYKAMQNAVASQEEWKAAMTGAGGWMEQTNSRFNTAEESIQTLEQKVAPVYDASMFSVDEWAYGNMTATAGISLSGNSNDLGNGRRIRSTMLLPYSQTMRFDLHAGWGIQFIFYDREGLCTGKSTNRIIADDSISGESIGAGYLLPAGTSFIGVVLGKGDNGVLDSVSRVGESGFRLYDRENSTSVIQQTATLIRQEVAGTGIDIMKGKINLRGDKVTFSSSDGTVTDKVGIDPATGTLHMENAVISGATMIDSVKVFRDNDITLGSPVYLHVYEHADDPSSGDTYLKDIRLKGNRFIMRCWKGGNYTYLRELNIYIPPAEYFKGQTIVICNSLYCTKAYSSSVFTKVKTTLMVDLTLTLLSKEAQDAGDIAYSDSVVGKLRPSTGQLYVLQANEEWLVNGIYCHDAMTGVMGTLVDSLDISDYEWLELTAWESEFYDAGNALRHAVEWKMLRWSKGGGES